MSNHYEIPSWAGKPPTGLHLDVMKDDKLIQKLMIDEKKSYLFGRNPQMNDFCIDHASCSRVHAAFVYHKHLNIAYLVDLGSTHGTFIGSIRLEAHKPTHLQINSTFSFGASTRFYILRERPAGSRTNQSIKEDIPMDTTDNFGLGLPENQTELDNLTEYNTAHNRRISMLGISDDSSSYKKNLNKNKRKRKGVQFNEEEIIINPEDIDPTIGRFRNLIQSTVIPMSSKKMRLESTNQMGIPSTPLLSSSSKHSLQQIMVPNLYQGLNDPIAEDDGHRGTTSSSIGFDIDTKLGQNWLPNPAPDVNPSSSSVSVASSSVKINEQNDINSDEPKKKKYAKEQWPGRNKPLLGGF
uniref:Nuclear inhibitor of protein phosphatase 1 n=1 Tax=Corethrella appendiculata TaxID=1370023 RepID=U5EWH8_9DIPT